jgi:hypothetical protein
MKTKYNTLLFLLLSVGAISLSANNPTKLEKQLNSILLDNRYFEGVPELGIISTSSSTVKFQKIFIQPDSGKIFKIGKKGEGPNEFKSFPNIFSDGNYLYVNDTGGKKIIVYNPANEFRIKDIISTKNLRFPMPKVIGKFENIWIIATLNIVKWKTKKKQYSLEIILWTSNDLTHTKKLLTIADLNKNAKENTLRISTIFLTGLKTVTINNKHFIIIDKQLDTIKSQTEISVYSFDNRIMQQIKFNIDGKLKKHKAMYRGFLGLNFKYYATCCFEENKIINTLVNTVGFPDCTTTKHTFSMPNQTIFGSLGEHIILQNIVSDNIDLKIVDSKKLFSGKRK